MNSRSGKLGRLRELIRGYGIQEGPVSLGGGTFGMWKTTSPCDRKPTVDQAAIWIVVQGSKVCYSGNERYDYRPGNVVVLLCPMSVEYEIVTASPQEPYMAAGVAIDMGRIADVLLRIDRFGGPVATPESSDLSGMLSTTLNDRLLEPFVRLFELLENPRDVAVLGASTIDEIYYRLLCNERGGELRSLLQSHGEVQRVAKAVDYIHENVAEVISIGQLAQMVHMGQTTFYETFRSVMHMSPLQYIKSVKLHRAYALIKAGKAAAEAAYLVGYNSPAQFSREYKRRFGFTPSAT